ncbi:hypothetical protein PMG71_05785 [Roseofilum sp. BLCC_M154]|uniref:Uncharacterized protein n=1 Tax=Roseofilum acuticapitatum BLCC-M154 TaxID=3022444 RepID=A0ABT7APW7_9CYAN|nr:hypothetical protein [Roseofilum acuticapitatum]MDJ1168931.1 hypothetical protein [Roseofilum acuticapitatum BLCC-M154]
MILKSKGDYYNLDRFSHFCVELSPCCVKAFYPFFSGTEDHFPGYEILYKTHDEKEAKSVLDRLMTIYAEGETKLLDLDTIIEEIRRNAT